MAQPKHRPQRSRGDVHNAPDHRRPTPTGWPTGRQIALELDLDPIAAYAVRRMSADDVLAALRLTPPRVRDAVVSNALSMRRVAAVNRGMAAQVLNRLQADGRVARSDLLHNLTAPLVSAFQQHTDPAVWAAVLGNSDEAALRTFARHPGLGPLLNYAGEFGPDLATAAFVSAIAQDSAASAAALSIVAVDDEAARTAHEALRVSFPELPEIPAMSAARLTPKARLAAVDSTSLADFDEDEFEEDELGDYLDDDFTPTPASDGAHGLDGAQLVAFDDELPEGRGEPRHDAGLRDVEQALEQWDWVVEASQSIADSLRTGELPDPDLIDDVAEHAEAAAEAVIWLSGQLGMDVPESREGIRDAADDLAARTERATAETVWLRRLTLIEGPAELSDLTAEVRTAADSALEDPSHSREALTALWRFVELTSDRRAGLKIAYATLADARSAVASAWSGIEPLLDALSFGDIVVPAATGAQDGPSAPLGPPIAREAPADAVVVPESRLLELDDLSPDGEQRTLEEAVDQREDLEQIVADRPAEEEPVEDLASLATLLDGGVGAALEAISNPGRRVEVPAPRATPDEGDASAEAVNPEPLDAAAETARVADALLARDRFGLAADLLEASGAPAASGAARRLAAYAAMLRAPAGPLASAFADLEPAVSRETLADDRAGQLIALMAAARIALLAPSAGPAKVLSKLLACAGDQPNLSEALNALVEASRSGVVVLAEAADAVGTLAAVETRAHEAAARAAELRSGATRRSFKYVPAAGVYQAWMSAEGELGRLLALVESNNPENAPEVRNRVVALRGRANKAIDTTFAGQRRNNSNRIVAGARSNLIGRWDEVIDCANLWAEWAERVAERRETAIGDWHAAALTKLRTRLRDVRRGALDELNHISGEPATVGAVRRLFTETLAICDGNVPDFEEPAAVYAAHGELLASSLPLDATTLLPDGGLAEDHLPELHRLAEREQPSPEEVYDQRSARGDHDLTAVLIKGVRPADPELAAELERRRSADIQHQSVEVGKLLDELADRIATRRLDGTLDDQPWAALAARVEALKDSARQDFGRVRAAIADIGTDLDIQRDRAVERTVERIQARAKKYPSVAQVAETLLDWARRGDVASAEESLEMVTNGGGLPSRPRGVNHLAAFFPSVPQALADRPRLLDEMHMALAGPSDAGDRRLAEVGLDLTGLSPARREAGRRALDAWKALTDGASERNQRRGDITTALRPVLAQAGLEFGDARIDRTVARQKGREWVVLKNVSGTGNAVTPAFGSAMSPDGSTLRVVLVSSAPTPATLIEWMAGEPQDQTVLAVWLAGALSPADRRAIANAARSRPKPPLLLLDAACLAYLICQNEPRRSTFAATALPFTGASPYRDTPGDTAPEMFYGRVDELDAVLDPRGSSFVSGGRQLGKSALLRTAARRFESDRPGNVAVLISLYNTVGADGRPELLWGALWPKLADLRIVEKDAPPAPELAKATVNAILTWLRADQSRALLILVDEADAFLDADAAGNRFTHVDWCRQLMLESDRRAKVVFAGLHRTARFESLPNQPLSHLGRPISIGPLRPQHAHELLTEPLAALGFTFADESTLPARILAMANNLPALLQLFGEALVRHLTSKEVPPGGPPQVITAEDVDDVFSDQALLAEFRGKYVLTLNLDHRYLVIAYTVAEAAHNNGIDASLSLTELSAIARGHWPAGFSGVGADDFKSLVTECVDLGVLALDGGRYRLRTPMVLRLLGTEDEVLDALTTSELVVPSASDAASYRRRIGETSCSPLTERQVGRILDARRTVLTLVGSPALQVDRVALALEKASQETAGLIREVQRCTTLTPDGIRHAVSKAPDATLIVIDARAEGAAKLSPLLTAAEEAVATARLDVTVAFVTSPANGAAWVVHPNRVELARVDEPGLRLWCDEHDLPFRDEQARSRLLAASGGWPLVLEYVTRKAANVGSAAGYGELLADLREWLAGKGRRELVNAAGLGAGGEALAVAFRDTIGLCGPEGEEPAALAEVLELVPDLATYAATAGYKSMDDVVAALVSLGCLASDDAGRLHPEPLLANLVPTVLETDR